MKVHCCAHAQCVTLLEVRIKWGLFYLTMDLGRNVVSTRLDSHSVQLQLVYRELVAAKLLGEQVATAPS